MYLRRMKRYGPYTMKSGHILWTVVHENGKRESVLEHREIVEANLGRRLSKDEVVHHINGIPNDNRLENLEIKSPSNHAKHHARQPEYTKIICAYCGKASKKLSRQLRHNQGHGKYGPFCNKSCSGSWSRGEQIKSGMRNLRQRRQKL